ncbi:MULTISPECIES: hypothetical protein [unclassified Dysgonomonas]|uniref:hypothetical protein n=1 Tax=unclassified Dysgonomonas TaxID=2630389 RepID=UPI0006810A44|nr:MULTISPECIES: hypothetical protein [unclassified Dysgonomonas]MBD8348789.1 hypothetical protein [Dysgonomonas sp. HGC4]MBF0576256.1 hypothetical protein [Dysgonomonas sp. GY617]
MTKYILTTFLLLVGLHSFSQENNIIIDADKFSEEQLSNIANIASPDGWVLLKYEGENHLSNFSNKDYILYFSIKCTEPSQKPLFLIEYSNNYRDGDYGGIDFVSSKDDHREVIFLLDGKEFKNPFKNPDEIQFEGFIEALKKATVLTINIYDYTASNELELNRSLDFKLGNGELLESTVNCY